jgi:hypothetical protein
MGKTEPKTASTSNDPVNHPPHYTWIQGMEVIDITETLNFCMGNAVKYILRADFKGKPIEDMRKAIWYLEREIQRRAKATELEHTKPVEP